MRARVFAALGLLLLLAGCGGGGGTSLPSPFMGSWLGTADLANGTQGAPSNVTVAVDSQGHISGTWSDSSGNGSVTGGVTNGGTANIAVGATGATPYLASGVTTIAQDGSWGGSLLVKNGPAAGGSIALHLVKQ